MFNRALIAASVLALCGTASATTVYSTNFEGSTAEWSGSGAVVPTFGNKYLSNADAAGTVAGASVATFTVAAGTAVQGASVSLLLGIIDSWDGGASFGPDSFNVQLDGVGVFSAVFDNFNITGPTVAPGLTNVYYNASLIGNSSYNDSVYNLTVNVGTLSAGAHTLKFFASGPGWQGGLDESLSLDDVSVQGTVVAVPEPETYGLALAGLAVLGAMSFKRKR